jgi:two-component system sensor histidine kinase VicK
VLRSFNFAGERRAQRKQKIQLEHALALQQAEEPEPSTPGAPGRVPQPTRMAKAPGAPPRTSLPRAAARKKAHAPTPELAWLPALAKDEIAESDRGASAHTSLAAPERAEATQAKIEAKEQLKTKPRAEPGGAGKSDLQSAPTTVRVALDPMVGRRVDAETLLLYRTVVAGEQGYRQGLLVEAAGLGDWLDREVIGPSRLAGASTVAFFDATGQGSARRGGSDPKANEYVYRHRFAEPFDAIGVELGLAPLPGGRGTGTIYALAILLGLVGAGGLFAVYRMVSVVVEFAERRNHFVAAVSHELKTPLTSIRMYAEMLRDGIVSGEAKRSEYYRTITDESERLSRLIDNVLDFSRLEKGEREVRAQDGPLWPVVLEAVEKLRPHAEVEGFALTPRTEDELPNARFDRDVVTQVIFNLVDNALKYAAGAERKEIAIDCRARPGRIELAVRDYGAGVPSGDLARIFEPFFRREDELTRTTKGTGIGLALVKELVESMGGAISASNADGGGLCVAILLPSAAEAAPAA